MFFLPLVFDSNNIKYWFETDVTTVQLSKMWKIAFLGSVNWIWPAYIWMSWPYWLVACFSLVILFVTPLLMRVCVCVCVCVGVWVCVCACVCVCVHSGCALSMLQYPSTSKLTRMLSFKQILYYKKNSACN